MEGTPYIDVEDRISRLPDTLIHQIMSFMDTKYAVQTCVLSKRWIHVWKSLPFLDFDRDSFSQENTERFIDFVYMVFMFRNDSTNIHKFSLDWEDAASENYEAIRHVNRWWVNAVKHNVQEVNIYIDKCSDSPYEIPHLLLNCKSLIRLVMRVYDAADCLDIILPRSMSLPQLKVLNFYGLSISGVEFFERLLSSCPVLKTLYIEECVIQTDNRMNLIVDSLSLRLFEYTCCRTQVLPQDDTMTDIIKLNSPILEYFSFKSLLTHDYSLEVCSPLFEVLLSVSLKESENADTYLELTSTEKAVYAKRAMKYLRAVCMVTEIILSPGFLEVLSQSPDFSVCETPWLRNLNFLTMAIWCSRGCLRSIAYLLNISPNISRLHLVSEVEVNLTDVGDDWEAGLSVPGMLSQLKSVRFEEVEGCDGELKLLSFLLKNAKALQKVALSFRSSSGSRVKQFEAQIRAVPTASSGIEMVFEQNIVGDIVSFTRSCSNH